MKMNDYNIVFTSTSFEDYEYWQQEDRKVLKKINKLIKSIQRNGTLEGEGKPEVLKGNLQGFYSRRVTQEHRLVYRVEETNLIIIACRYYYK